MQADAGLVQTAHRLVDVMAKREVFVVTGEDTELLEGGMEVDEEVLSEEGHVSPLHDKSRLRNSRDDARRSCY